MNNFLKRLDFKRIFTVYIIFAALLIVIFGGIAVHRNAEKIRFAADFAAASIKINLNADAGDKIENMAEMAVKEDDVSELLKVNDSNTVVMTTNDRIAGVGNKFVLESGSGDFLENDLNPDAVYKSVDKSDFLLASLLPVDLTDISEEYINNYFYRENFSEKQLYLISYLGNDGNGNKIYIINTAAELTAGASALKNAAAVSVFVFMIYWLLLALWVYSNALRGGLAAPFWGIAVLLTNIIGVMVYELYKHSNEICPYCGKVQQRSAVYCSGCGMQLKKMCANCGKAVGEDDRFCPECGISIEKRE